jgi:hypothetical protein
MNLYIALAVIGVGSSLIALTVIVATRMLWRKLQEVSRKNTSRDSQLNIAETQSAAIRWQSMVILGAATHSMHRSAWTHLETQVEAPLWAVRAQSAKISASAMGIVAFLSGAIAFWIVLFISSVTGVLSMFIAGCVPFVALTAKSRLTSLASVAAACLFGVAFLFSPGADESVRNTAITLWANAHPQIDANPSIFGQLTLTYSVGARDAFSGTALRAGMALLSGALVAWTVVQLVAIFGGQRRPVAEASAELEAQIATLRAATTLRGKRQRDN